MKKVLLMLLIPFFLFSACATSKVSESKDYFKTTLFSSHKEIESMWAYQKLIRTSPGTRAFEQARIDYLMERLGESQDVFIRNGESYTARRALMHLRWKYQHYRNLAPTAEDFIEQIASKSNKTGEAYYVKTEGGELCPARVVMQNELKALDEYFGATERLR